jgi:hypothetical protein
MDRSKLVVDEFRTIEELLSRDITLAQQRVTRRCQELKAIALHSTPEEEKARLVRYVSAGLEAARMELNDALLAFSAFIAEGVAPVVSTLRARPHDN